MSISAFLNNPATTFSARTNLIFGRTNSSSVESALRTVPIREEGHQGNLISVLNSIGAIYSIPYVLYQKGLTYTEIASKLDLPEGTVKSRIFTGRVKIKHMLAERK